MVTSDLPYGATPTPGSLPASQAFDAGKLGVERIGVYAMVGQAPLRGSRSGGLPLPGSGIGNKTFSRVGFVGQFYFGPHFGLPGCDATWLG